jgi:hypothetical protein
MNKPEFVLLIKKNDNVVTLEGSNRHTLKVMIDMMNNILDTSNCNSLLCLDLHGVADLFPHEQNFNLPTCIISFVGYKNNTYNIACADITKRLMLNKILFGVLVFIKTSESGIVGSKDHIINNIIASNVNVRNIIFLDDSIKNIESTKHGIKVKTYLINAPNDDDKRIQILKIINS